MENTYLVARRIAQIGKVKLASGAFANAWGIFTCTAAFGESGFVPCIGCCGIVRCKTDSAAIAVAGGLSVDGLAYREYSAFSEIEATPLVVDYSRLVTQRPQYRIVKSLRLLYILSADHDMTEHCYSTTSI